VPQYTPNGPGNRRVSKIKKNNKLKKKTMCEKYNEREREEKLEVDKS